jgi:hypothetical protein
MQWVRISSYNNILHENHIIWWTVGFVVGCVLHGRDYVHLDDTQTPGKEHTLAYPLDPKEQIIVV